METENKLKEYQRINILIWIAILAFVVILTLLTFVLDSSRVFIPVDNSAQINQIMFLIAVVIAFVILFFKRSLFIPGKIVDISFEKSLPEKVDIVLIRIRKNYIIVWALGEAIGIIGFVNYIFTVDRQYFLVFAVVSIYSILINMPRLALAERCVELIQENK